MKCDYCDNEAVVRDTVKEGGQYVAKHFCAEHAAEHGIGVQVSPSPAVGAIIKATISQGQGHERSPACSSCGITYAEFRRSGVLGCPECYDAFEPQLGPLLERAHEGGLHHVGKIPRRALASSRGGCAEGADNPGPLGDREALRKRLSELDRQLRQAVRSEQFERAARLRDEISTASSMLSDLEAPQSPSDRSGGEGGPGPFASQ